MHSILTLGTSAMSSLILGIRKSLKNHMIGQKDGTKSSPNLIILESFAFLLKLRLRSA